MIAFIAPTMFNAPEILMRKEIAKIESPYARNADFSQFKNIKPNLPVGSTAFLTQGDKKYGYMLKEDKVSLKTAFNGEVLRSMGLPETTVYSKRGEVTNHFEVSMLIGSVESKAQCHAQARERIIRLSNHLNTKFYAKNKVVQPHEDAYAIVDGGGFFSIDDLHTGFYCNDKNIFFIVAQRDLI
ncbi:hypothetical protein P5704_024485 (plasmid) [Pseudomonas sp. FeN3W]|nr:hypothetical protein P5704_024485 [Pseudomonas sp. FeN3W]